MQTSDRLLDITQEAALKLRQIRFCQERHDSGLRIQVLYVAGCTGPAYYIGLEDDAQAGDVVSRCDDVALYVDPESAAIVRGGVLDYAITPEGEGFLIHLANPVHIACSRCPECVSAKSEE